MRPTDHDAGASDATPAVHVARADFWQLALGRDPSVETPFVVSGPASLLTNGVIDLLFQSNDDWQVVDYKTDLELDDETYDPQLDTYRTALRRIGCDVVNASVVGVRSKA